MSTLNRSIAVFYQNGTPFTIETEQLILRPVQKEDEPFFQMLYTDPDTMNLYTDNEFRLKEKGLDAWKEEQMKNATSRVAIFIKRWTIERIPFSGFVLCKKDQENTRVGFIVVGFGDRPGQAETAFAVKKEEQRHGYGSEAVNAMIQRYIPALIETHQKVYGKPLEMGGAPLTDVEATARLDNESSIRRMEHAGMKKVEENEKWGALRGVYRITYTNPKV